MVSRLTMRSYVLLVFLPLYVSGCGADGVGYVTGQKQDIGCDKFPLKVTLAAKVGYPVKCTKRNSSEAILIATRYHMFFRFVLEDRSFANIHFAEAGDGTLINARSVTRKMKTFKRVRTGAKNWGQPSDFQIRGWKYGSVTFDLPKNRSCIGFNGYQGIKNAGYGKNIYGYLCSIKTQIKPSHLKDLLSHLEIRR